MLLHRPSLRSEAHDGAIVSGWFHIKAFPYDPSDRDDENLFKAARGLKSVIARERTRLIRKERGLRAGQDADDYEDDETFGLPDERLRAMKRIFVAGFSQGSVVSLLTAFTHPEEVGGVIVLSGFLPVRTDLARVGLDLRLLSFVKALTRASLVRSTYSSRPTWTGPSCPSFGVTASMTSFAGA